MMHRSGSAHSGSKGGNYKTGSLQHTLNYTWNTADALGKGATAVVYYGRHKETGDVCAVKVFHDRMSRYMSTTRQREIESLRALQHENIVKLIALETEESTGHEVLVMEYCSGGSLYTMLDQPQYAYGFPEPEFKLFLKHIANGTQYLRQMGYVHRDIKPGNIMRLITDDGRSLYKLTDFGAARELQDDETFTSIYGTEEYLYPGMYEQAVLRRPGPQNFNASVDLWSLGVTIFHVGTGFLPFQPYGGRANAQTMHTITSKKPQGAISGIQSTPSGPIKWETKLPETCLLSRQLQMMLVPMLSGLMETNPMKMWSFDMFFKAVSEIDKMLVFRFFFCCVGELSPLYICPGDTISNIHEKIAMETDIAAGHQLILWHDKQLCEVVEPDALAQNYPRVICNSVLYVINKMSMEGGTLKPLHIPPFPEVPSIEHLDSDASMSKKAAAIGCLMCTCIKLFLDQQSHLYDGELLFRQYLKRVVWRSEWIVPEIKRVLEETNLRLESTSKTFSALLNLFRTLDSSLQVEERMTSAAGSDIKIRNTVQLLSDCVAEKGLTEFYEKIKERLGQIVVYVEVLSRRIAEQEVERLNQEFGCVETDYCQSKAESLKNKIINVHSTMTRHRKYGDLHHHEQFIHKCEKQKLQEYCISLWTLANDHCRSNLQLCFKASQKEFCNLAKHLTRTKKVEQNIISVKDSLTTFSQTLLEKEVKCRGIVETITRLMNSTLLRPKVSHSGFLSAPGRTTKSPSPLASTEYREKREATPPDGTDQEIKGEQPAVSYIRSELPLSVASYPGAEMTTGQPSKPKKQRTELLDKLATELMSLKTDSDQLKQLVIESSDVMKQFLTETSNLHVEGSLDSDQRRFQPDVT